MVDTVGIEFVTSEAPLMGLGSAEFSPSNLRTLALVQVNLDHVNATFE